MSIINFNQLLEQVGELWGWIIGLIAGLGLTATLLIAVFAVIYYKLLRLEKMIQVVENHRATEDRDLSLRLRKLEK